MCITRIDFMLTNVEFNAGSGKLPDCIIRKWAEGWVIGQFCDQQDTKENFNLEEALAWCTSHGWQVHKWSGGARAWLGEVRPIRSEKNIKARRASLRREARGFNGQMSLIPDYTDWGIFGHDLAFDW